MTEDLKFIVAEINKLLKTEYNLISFDSLSVENLLQILLDVLEKFGAANRVNYLHFLMECPRYELKLQLKFHSSKSRSQTQQTPISIYWIHWRKFSIDRLTTTNMIPPLSDDSCFRVTKRQFTQYFNSFSKTLKKSRISHIWHSPFSNNIRHQRHD